MVTMTPQSPVVHRTKQSEQQLFSDTKILVYLFAINFTDAPLPTSSYSQVSATWEELFKVSSTDLLSNSILPASPTSSSVRYNCSRPKAIAGKSLLSMRSNTLTCETRKVELGVSAWTIAAPISLVIFVAMIVAFIVVGRRTRGKSMLCCGCGSGGGGGCCGCGGGDKTLDQEINIVAQVSGSKTRCRCCCCLKCSKV